MDEDTQWVEMQNIAASLPQKAWALKYKGDSSQHGAVYQCSDGWYRLYYWGFLKGYKYKDLEEAKAVMAALCRLGELDHGLGITGIRKKFGFEIYRE